jgi:cytoskeleton protein RodZ
VTATTPTLTAPGLPDSAVERVAGQVDGGDAQVLVSFISNPAGATVSIDGFALPGVTPLVDVPLSARGGRLVRVELEGHRASENVVDLLNETTIERTLEPLRDAEPVATSGELGRIQINITNTSWLEVYRGLARNEGERLIFRTAQPGATFSFDPPIFVYVGNAAGVRVTRDGQDLGALGGPGVVLGRAFED